MSVIICPGVVVKLTETVMGRPQSETVLDPNDTEASEQLVVVEVVSQSVLSSPDEEFPPPVCALLGVGVNQPENSRPRVKVAIIMNASSIGRRPASFNAFLLICV